MSLNLSLIQNRVPPSERVSRLEEIANRSSRTETDSLQHAKRAIVSMSCLGRIGGFGDQLFQYAFLKQYASRHGLEVRTPKWVGQQLFGHNDRDIERELPMFYETGPTDATRLLQLQRPLTNIDLWGHFQCHTSSYSRELWRELFKPAGDVAKKVSEVKMRLRSRGSTIVGLHVRAWESRQGLFDLAVIRRYHDWLAQRWSKLERPVLFIASENPQVIQYLFSAYSPVVAQNLNVDLPGLEYYLDFYLLTQCDILALSNTTFSAAAAMLNENLQECFRHLAARGGIVPFDPWDDLPSVEPHQHAAEYAAALRQASQLYVSSQDGPTASAEVEQLRSIRRELADCWLGADDAYLTVSYLGDLGRAHRNLLRVRQVGLTADEISYKDSLLQWLAKNGLGSEWSIQYLLAAMLFSQPDELPVDHDLAQIPQFLRADYFNYVTAAANSSD